MPIASSRVVATIGVALVLCGCGSIGDPLPPALNIPKPVKDLSAVQRGSDIIVTFTAPEETAEDLTLNRITGIDLRIADKQVPAALPTPGQPVTIRVPASEWSGTSASVTVRIAGPKGRYSPNSNAVTVNAGPALAAPEVAASSHPQGVRLTWKANPGEQYRIFRDDVQIGIAPAGEYVDSTAVFGKQYNYSVQAFISRRESEPAKPLTVTPRDEFAPAVPAGLTAVAGVKSIELTWDRNSESDLATYRVYRATTAAFTVLADAIDATSSSDRQIESGTTYKYRITATDKSGNESEPSKPLEIRAP